MTIPRASRLFFRDFLKNAFPQIKEGIAAGKHGQDATLSLVEISIKKALCYDPQLNKYLGFSDFPDDRPSSKETEHLLLASQVLVFYAVELDGKWRSLVAYYYTNHLSGLGQSKVLTNVIEAWMVSTLGANIRFPEVPKTFVAKRRKERNSEQIKADKIK